MTRSLASRRLALCGVALLIAATGCDLRAGPEVRETALRIQDAGLPPPVDAGGPPRDAGGPAPDAGPPDAGPPDAGVPDGGVRDGGTHDGGLPDGGTPGIDAGVPGDGGPPDGGPGCGDGVCSGGETSCSCPVDCGNDPADGCCGAGEDSCTSPGECGAVCGDQCCSGDETSVSCPADCGDSCGDGVCGSSEDAGSCASDCPPACGDGTCNGDETTCSCSSDCGPSCGDGCCDPASEDACGCPSDCSPVEGDSCCTGGESSATSPCDCPATCGDGVCNGDATTCDDGLENSCNCEEDCGATCGDGCCNGDESGDPSSPGFCECDCGDDSEPLSYNMCPLDFDCQDDGFGCGGWGPGECQDCAGCATCTTCGEASCCTLADLDACPEDMGAGDECQCGCAFESIGVMSGGAEALEYVAQITSKALPDGSLEVKGSLLLKGGKSYSVVGEPIIVKIAQGSASGMPQQARAVAAVTDIVGQLETRYAAQVANATRTGFTCRALTWAGKNLPKIGLIGAIFILVEVSALAGEHLPPLIIPNTVAKLKGEGGLRERCTEFAGWYKKLFMEEEHPMQQGTSCETCVERSIGTAPPCEGATDQCTWCSQSATNPNAAYQDLKNGVENLKWHFAKACAGRPGGYYTRRHGGENGLRRQVAAGYTVDAICPHR